MIFYLERKSRLNKYQFLHIAECELLPLEDGRIELENHESLSEVLSILPNNIKICSYCFKNKSNQLATKEANEKRNF
ncbi:hypothetical protein DSM04_11052 [Leeuwenhoekiella aestuarii]|uniref:Uncharacterized protein n=1 Tax=Leeuwenhoekiella aestuarii TaxID=2249426 RepID=A0A4Q0NPT8_9FLAO|nr:hypothetical protein DSM04_11052 [Leeuwenhoekiella aestuarii]